MPMNRTEFLETLRGQLLTEMTPIQAASHVQYYEDYITGQTAAGRSEEEILVQLGDPRLIAKTIMDTGSQGSDHSHSYESSAGTYDESAKESRPYGRKRLFASVDLSTWYGKMIVILMSAAILFLLITILSALVPVVLIVCAVLFVISQLKKRS